VGLGSLEFVCTNVVWFDSARQAYLFNQQHSGHVLDQVDDALRTVLSAPYFSRTLLHEKGLQSVAFSPDGQWLASGMENGGVRLWEMRQPEAAPTILRHEGEVSSVAFSPDGQRLASGSQTGRFESGSRGRILWRKWYARRSGAIRR
jgi:WD40 repeat protein